MRRLLADENFPFPSVKILRDSGYDVVWVKDNNAGMSDIEVIALADREERLLVTFDRDFGELIVRFNLKPKMGVVYLRTSKHRSEEPGIAVHRILTNASRTFENKITIYDGKFIRQRDY